MIASKKVKREECTLDDFLTELFDNKNHRFGEKLRLKFFQKNELIGNLRRENDFYRTMWENNKFEMNPGMGKTGLELCLLSLMSS